MAKIILYGMDISPPVRACYLTLKALGLDFEYKILNLFNGEHMEEDFLKHNPQHTIPLLKVDDDYIWDSHAICSFLVDKFATDDSLYPKDLLKRAQVNQRMYFDASVLFMSLRNISMPMFRDNVTVVEKEKTANVVEAYNLLEAFLGENLYLVGDKMTIADFCCVATVSSMVHIVPIDPIKYPKISSWTERISKLPYYEEANGKGAEEYTNILKTKLTEIKI